MHTVSIPQKPKHGLRLLHTSDWHLGKQLFGHSRYDEFGQFLDWLVAQITLHQVDVVIVAGDIFDTATPSNKAQELYYGFLNKIAKSPCRHVIITAGNHDSPTFLDAPKSLLKTLNVRVVGQISDDLHDEVLLLDDENPIAIVLAVPYLRDRDVRTSMEIETVADKTNNTERGIARHYQELAVCAKSLQEKILHHHRKHVPIIATGHLFVAGSATSADDDGMRKELSVGTLGQMPASIFDKSFNYVALGHIHAAQMVAGQEHIRYSGSPIAMGFGEIGKQKQVSVVDFCPKNPKVYSLHIPVFQQLARISGNTAHIMSQLDDLIAQNTLIYTDIEYTGKTLEPQLAQKIRTKLERTQVLVLNIKNRTHYQHALRSSRAGEDLSSLDEYDVFHRLLQQQNIHDDDTNALLSAYQIVLKHIHETQ